MSDQKSRNLLAAYLAWMKDPQGNRPTLGSAKLRAADLSGADLSDADLSNADLRNADLRAADLRAADLSDADLSGADLSGADLSDTNLCGANLCGANLRSANLRDADLREADLHDAEGWIPLCQTDHGFLVAASWHGTQWRIQAGCRDFTITEAREHWGSPDYHMPSSGSRVVHMLDWLEKQPTPKVKRAKL